MTKLAKRSLFAIERHISQCAESIRQNGIAIGQDLIELRDQERWVEGGFDSWNEYLKERAPELVGKSFVQSVKLIRAAEISKRLPSKIVDDLTPSHLIEIGRLAPDVGKDSGGKEKDYGKLKETDAARVIKSATAIADTETPTVRDIRKAVDEELGIDRAAQAAATKVKREKESQIDLSDLLSRIRGTMEGWQALLSELPDDVLWFEYRYELEGAIAANESLNESLHERNGTKQPRRRSAKRFTPPTVEEVRAYSTSRKSKIDPEQFVDYYQARGWRHGNNQTMKDWQATFRTWERNEQRPRVTGRHQSAGEEFLAEMEALGIQ